MKIISRKVWRKGWRKEAAATQAAARRFAELLDYLEQGELSNVAADLRNFAKKAGVREAETMFLAAIKAVQEVRQSETSTRRKSNNPTS
jgi:hypothetical protein